MHRYTDSLIKLDFVYVHVPFFLYYIHLLFSEIENTLNNKLMITIST